MVTLKQRNPSIPFESLKTPAIISSMVVLPFLILELLNRQNPSADFPIALFVVLWILSLSFMIILMPVMRGLPAGSRNMPNAVSLVPRIVLLLVIAWLWMSLVVDQMPCFLGVPNCD